MFCKNCGREIDDRAVVCPHCGVMTNNSMNAPVQQTNTLAIIGFVLSFLIPLVGLILSIIGYNKSKELGGSGKGFAIAGIIIAIAIMVFYFLLGLTFGALFAEMFAEMFAAL